jgi:hypothetical protein
LLFLFSAQEPNQKWFYFQFSIAYRSVAIFSSTGLKIEKFTIYSQRRNTSSMSICQFGFRLLSADKMSIAQHRSIKVEAIDGLVNGNGVLSCLKVTSEKQ